MSYSSSQFEPACLYAPESVDPGSGGAMGAWRYHPPSSEYAGSNCFLPHRNASAMHLSGVAKGAISCAAHDSVSSLMIQPTS